MTIPLEDTYLDVLGKAQRGLGLSDADAATRAQATLDDWQALRAGQRQGDSLLRAAALALGLDGSALVALAHGAWSEPSVECAGLRQLTTPFDGGTVNHYLVTDQKTRQAALFDTGTNPQPVLEVLRKEQWKITAIFLTHTHGDHILELDLLKEKTGAPAYVRQEESLEGATPFVAGTRFSIGSLTVQTRATSGHSRGGTTYLISGLERGVAIVGDALFAGSMGGANHDYAEALRSNRDQIFSMPEDTILCPGHGPCTTVGQESRFNPFFAGAKTS